MDDDFIVVMCVSALLALCMFGILDKEVRADVWQQAAEVCAQHEGPDLVDGSFWPVSVGDVQTVVCKDGTVIGYKLKAKVENDD